MKKKKQLLITECWLYAVASKSDLARRLSVNEQKITVDDLNQFASDEENYRLFLNKDGRPIQEPIRELQKVHKRIHKLLSRVVVPEYLHSAVRGKSYMSNARAHAAAIPTIKIDVRKFFPSVPRKAVYRFFADSLKCRSDVAGILADILTFNARLPTGSSASPIIAFYAFKQMFDELHSLANSNELRMTCYVDDITMSGARASRRVLQEARVIVAAAGLKSHKLRYFGPGVPRVITGICITNDGERVPNKLHRKIKQGFDALRASSSEEQNTKALRAILGRLGAAKQIDPLFGERAKTLRAQVAKGIFK